jgi:hypothetical protein
MDLIMPSEAATTSAIRRFLLGTFILGVCGTAAELLLLGHTEKAPQFAPLLLMATSLLALVWRIWNRGPINLRVFQAIMMLFALSGVAGLWLHYKANVEFELEMYPSLSGWELFLKAIRGTAPPSLAPGIMILLASIGLVYTYRHPAFTNSKGDTL